MSKYVVSQVYEEPREETKVPGVDSSVSVVDPGVREDAMIPEEVLDLATLTDGTDISQMRLHMASSNRLEFSQDDTTSATKRERKLPFHLYKHFSFPQHVHIHSDDAPERPTLASQFSQPSELNHVVKTFTVVPKQLHYTIDSDTQTQTEISWEVQHCEDFLDSSKLYFQVQIQQDEDLEWQNLSERRIPVIRLYSTDEVVVLDKRRWRFRDGAVIWLLRIRAVMKDTFNVNNYKYPWSEHIQIHIKGLPATDPKFVSDKKGSILY